MAEKGQASLESARQAKILLSARSSWCCPTSHSQGSLTLRVGKENFNPDQPPAIPAMASPCWLKKTGSFLLVMHSCLCHISWMAIFDELTATIKQIGKMGLENIIQGHGDIILRGEIEDAVKENLAYLSAIRKAVKRLRAKRNPAEALALIDVESCGKSRIYLGGLAEDLHRRNVKQLFRQVMAEENELQPAPREAPAH